MYILLIGYLYVILMFSAALIASKGVIYGLLVFVLLGVLPSWLLFWVKRRGQIVRARKAAETLAESGAAGNDQTSH
ncbi:hypothetical protein [Chitinilyticum piscinae]|uniref:Uncharacterized protein n=1 Tax=Chitinilyticum piscinae TaxID=2866724 RepID=A0A8J7FSY8_9NEIS|nr:hypothetical protein [Chitinilyticum piscinae]MBE9609966.1 hypothetical protein [Chitinilyticum piscinae]